MRKKHIIEIKRLRFSFLESRKDFSKRLGLTPTAVTNWEAGKRFPSLANIKKMSELASEKGVLFNLESFKREE